MELRNIKTFIYVAEQGSFSKAAQMLNYSQSTVTSQIQRLEQELDILLFERIGKTIRLTVAGQHFFQYAQQTLQMEDAVKMSLHNLPPDSGEVRIAMAESISNIFFTKILQTFHQRYPRIKVYLQTASTEQLLSMLKHNDVDLVYTLDKRIYSSDIITAVEHQEEVVFVCSTEHELAKGIYNLEAILQYDFMLTEKNMSYRKYLEDYLASKSMEIRCFLELGNVDILKHLVEQNTAMSFLPIFCIQESIAHKLVKPIAIPDKFYVWRQLIYHKNKYVSMPMKAMIEIIQEVDSTFPRLDFPTNAS